MNSSINFRVLGNRLPKIGGSTPKRRGRPEDRLRTVLGRPNPLFFFTRKFGSQSSKTSNLQNPAGVWESEPQFRLQPSKTPAQSFGSRHSKNDCGRESALQQRPQTQAQNRAAGRELTLQNRLRSRELVLPIGHK
ncbi:uncharacterized protein PGTG_20539 [Puccinia graminis f. sp. tritici CRL 75-36-700-3]|uniref:Uncharacterized protein n=1 Tax=Puccinia graminis f. sp. tritici (strain CRL 75-36-700-3 / race SCCL) TaxID=418459 RepID=E3NYD4_PUCGT|nr:uncharacterized protein PGTG_20539 [Puccinia graminis f. sp. tritici CRL 75-36-700-3]EFP94583.1 hypothetical protein PGTG_20539 [Puccinia graminis f. sp. tritici CRL 75-36-700-3]